MASVKKQPAALASAASRARGTASAANNLPPAAVNAAPEKRKGPAAVANEATCEAALMRVIRLARATLADVSERGGAAAPQPQQARESLESALEGLSSEIALKLRTLMIAGRDGKNVTDVNVNMTLGDSSTAFAAAALDASQNGPLLAEYLLRGHAMACAIALDLERPLADWSGGAPNNLDERAWLSFGKQLAKSEPGDWQCLAFVERDNQPITRLYLQLAEHAWWSFQAVLDRPSLAMVEKQRRSLSSRRSKGLATHSLLSIASKLSTAQGRALRRAARAIRARVGELSTVT